MNPLKQLSTALFGPQGLMGPRFPTDSSPGGQYSRLRYHALTIQREEAGIPLPPSDSPVWAVLMETGHPRLTQTLALVSDGTSSVYMSDGDGVIGGHGYENVRKANADFIKIANRDRNHFQPTESFPIPELGYTVFYARTDSGVLVSSGTQESLIHGRHALSELFQAGHEAITQLHIIVAAKELEKFQKGTSEDFYNRGVAYAEKAAAYHAIAAYDKAIQLDPNYFAAYHNRGVAYGALGNFDHALSEFNRAIALKPNDPLIYMNRANVYKFKKQSEEAVSDYSRAIEIDPGFAEAYLERGLFYKSLERRGDARRDFHRFLVLSRDPRKRKLVEEELRQLR
ncbi:MAG: tetratricopeptide repeat protein [Chloroflexota bacterium]|nr:tetratricopeptide repeat protein [Chloroflexota bacterium]